MPEILWWIIGAAVIVIVVVIIAAIVGFIIASKSKPSSGNSSSTYTSSTGSSYTHISKSELSGKWGEVGAFYHLQPLLKEDEYLLPNVLIPLSSGGTTEIDFVLISRKGVFCIEIKNWIGHIEGGDDDEYWIQRFDDPYKPDKQHKNPIKQNKKHCNTLRKFLNNNYDIDNIVIFVKLEDGRGIDSSYALTISEFKNYYLGLDDQLDELDIKRIYQKLRPCIATEEQLEKHKEDVRRRYEN